MRLHAFTGNALRNICLFHLIYQNYLLLVKMLSPMWKTGKEGILYQITDKQMNNKLSQLNQTSDLSGSPCKCCVKEVQMTSAKKTLESLNGTMSIQNLLHCPGKYPSWLCFVLTLVIPDNILKCPDCQIHLLPQNSGCNCEVSSLACLLKTQSQTNCWRADENIQFHISAL